MWNITSFVHLVFVLLFFSLPLFPGSWMVLIRWIPLVLILGWFIFGNCPLTLIDEKLDDQGFIQVLLKPFVTLDRKRIDALTHIVLLLVFAFCTKKYYAHMHNTNKQQK